MRIGKMLYHSSVVIGDNVNLAEDVQLEEGVNIGNNVTIYPKVTIKSGTRILDNAVIGRLPISTGNINRKVDSTYKPLTIGTNCVIGCNSVLYTNIQIGDYVMIGDLTRIREGCVFSDYVVIGGGVLVMYDTVVGTRSRIIDGAIITGNMIIENDVFVGPGVNSINDNGVYMARFGLETLIHKGPTIRRLAMIGAGANLSSGIEIGEGALVAPHAMVTKDVRPWTVVVGIPAREVREINEIDRQKIIDHINAK